MFAIWDKNADTPPYHAKRNDALETGGWPSEILETCLHTRGVAKSTKLSVTRYMFTKHSPNLHKTYVKLTKNLYKTAVNKMVLLEVARAPPQVLDKPHTEYWPNSRDLA
jgi:hypothetical protein